MNSTDLSPRLQSARRVLIIPARRHSTRLPDKLLLRETGKTVLQHTYETACRCRRADAVVVAVDDSALAREARQFGAPVVMTSPDCASGTDRVAEAARRLPTAELIVNLQGDEPDMDPQLLDNLFDDLAASPTASMATLATPIRDDVTLNDPSCVKVVCDAQGAALYFSRSAIPFVREWDPALLEADPPLFLQHLGVYAFRRETLLDFAAAPAGRWEQLECLEQLRILEAGGTIRVSVVDERTRGIDTPDDYRAFVARRLAG